MNSKGLWELGNALKKMINITTLKLKFTNYKGSA